MEVDLSRRALLTTVLHGTALSLSGLALGGCETHLEHIRNRPMRGDLATLPANDPIIDTPSFSFTRFLAYTAFAGPPFVPV